MLSGFKQFILRGNVVDLAVGLVVGASFQAVVTGLVKDFITPFVGMIYGQNNLSTLVFTFRHSKFLVGDFINSIVTFFIIAAVVYFFVVVPVNRLVNAVKNNKKLFRPVKNALSVSAISPWPPRDAPSVLAWYIKRKRSDAVNISPKEKNY